MLNEKLLKKFNRTEFSIKGDKGVVATFHIRRMPAIEGADAFDEVRGFIADGFGTASKAEDDLEFLANLVKCIPASHMKPLRSALFAYVDYAHSIHETSKTTLAGDEYTAFSGQGFDAVYEVLLRALVVNFLTPMEGLWRSLKAEVETSGPSANSALPTSSTA